MRDPIERLERYYEDLRDVEAPRFDAPMPAHPMNLALPTLAVAAAYAVLHFAAVSQSPPSGALDLRAGQVAHEAMAAVEPPVDQRRGTREGLQWHV